MLCTLGMFVSAGDASALWLFPRCLHRHHSIIICRPYNAFTPICHGSVYCNGCCPSPFCGPGSCGPIQSHFAPPMISNGCCDTGCAPGGVVQPYAAAPTMLPPPGTHMPLPSGPTFTPPPPMQNSQSSLRWNPQAMYGVQPAGYAPNYYPMNYAPINYYPTGYYPQGYNYPMVPATAVPYYWYNGN